MLKFLMGVSMHPYRPLTLAAALFVLGGLSPAFAQSGTEPSSPVAVV